MDPDEDGTLWRAVVTYRVKRIVAFDEETMTLTEVFGPYKSEPTAVGMISRLNGRPDIQVVKAHTESTDTHWKLVEEF